VCQSVLNVITASVCMLVMLPAAGVHSWQETACEQGLHVRVALLARVLLLFTAGEPVLPCGGITQPAVLH
jgi:hypothetical protein